MGDGPISLGTVVDVWEGTYRDKQVSIKSLRGQVKNSRALKKVRARDCVYLSCLLTGANTLGAVVVLQRGCGVEKVKSPECRTFHRYYDGSFATYFGGHAEGDVDGVSRGKSGSESHRLGEFLFFSISLTDGDNIVPS